MVVLAWGAVASVAQAQDKKSYIVFGYGLVASSGGETVSKTDNFGNVTTATYSEPGDYLRLGYGYHLNESLSLELAHIDIAGINTEVMIGSSSIEGGYASLSTTEGSLVYYKPLNEKTKLTLRGGLVSYSWTPLGEVDFTEFNKTSGTTLLLAVGAEKGNWQFELQSYDVTLTDNDGDNLYTGPMILSAGYKFRF